MSVEITGVTKIVFYKYKDLDTIWMDLYSFDSKVQVTVRIGARDWLQNMQVFSKWLQKALDNEDTSPIVLEQTNASRVETKAS